VVITGARTSAPRSSGEQRAATSSPPGTARSRSTCGDQIDANVTLAPNGELDEQDVEETGHTDAVEVQGKVVSVTGTPPTAITVQPEEGPAVTVQVPAGFQLPALTPGQEVELKASVFGTTLTLLKLSTDGGDNGEHDGNNNDEHGQNGDSNDQHGDGGGGGDG
jgi:hypothetical protein